MMPSPFLKKEILIQMCWWGSEAWHCTLQDMTVKIIKVINNELTTP
jgi:hypothetical protein